MRPNKRSGNFPPFWHQRGLTACLLWPLSRLFCFLARLRRSCLKPQRMPVPVIVVGGITVGGAGKTPLALWLIERLRQRGYRPGIVSRGYGGKAVGVIEVQPDSLSQVVGDEALLLRQRGDLPVFVCHDRVAAARALLEACPECNVLISDDGLQHYRLARDFEIVVLDRRGLMNGWCLPAGPLREAPARLAEVDALVLNNAEAPPGVQLPPVFRMQLHGERFYRLGMPEQTCMAEAFAGQTVHALAGIGEPQRFFDHLTALGLSIIPHAMPDHHRYAIDDLPPAGDVILTTEKDAVKLASIVPPKALPIWVLPVVAEVAGGLDQQIVEKLNGRALA